MKETRIPTILIAEDEEKISRIIRLQLEHSGYKTMIAKDGIEAIELAKNNHVDLVIMDIMMPNLDGIKACQNLKTSNQNLKIIMLTAKDEISDVIMGLDSGADDYMTKPFIFEELLARIRANLRSVNNQKSNVDHKLIIFKDLNMNIETYETTRSGELVELSKTEFDLLKYLVENSGVVMSRENILNNVWGYNFFGSPNVVDVYIKYLRDKIDRQHNNKLIHTVRGRGYIVK